MSQSTKHKYNPTGKGVLDEQGRIQNRNATELLKMFEFQVYCSLLKLGINHDLKLHRIFLKLINSKEKN